MKQRDEIFWRLEREGVVVDPGHLQKILLECQTVAKDASLGASSSDLIAELARVPADSFGMSVATVAGDYVSVGQSEQPFSIQSIAKLFSLIALLRVSDDAWNETGWGATEAGFRSLAELEGASGKPRNPYVNAGALLVADRLLSAYAGGQATTLELIRELSKNQRIEFSATMAESEAQNAHTNTALAHILADSGQIKNTIEDVLTSYFEQCAIEVSTQDLARACLFLADTSAAEFVLTPDQVKRVNASLLMGGMYQAATDFAFRVGMPAKSGIGGGIVAIKPGVGAVCVWSPPLNSDGNSIGGLAALEAFSGLSGWSIF